MNTTQITVCIVVAAVLWAAYRGIVWCANRFLNGVSDSTMGDE